MAHAGQRYVPPSSPSPEKSIRGKRILARNRIPNAGLDLNRGEVTLSDPHARGMRTGTALPRLHRSRRSGDRRGPAIGLPKLTLTLQAARLAERTRGAAQTRGPTQAHGASARKQGSTRNPRDLSKQEFTRPRGHPGLGNRGRQGSDIDPPSGPLEVVQPLRWLLPRTGRRDLGLSPSNILFNSPITVACGTDDVQEIASGQPGLVDRGGGRVNSSAPGLEEGTRARPAFAARRKIPTSDSSSAGFGLS